MTQSKVGLAVVVALGVVVQSPPTEACGGFFCSQTPVNQAGENLLFSIEDDGTVVAHIQILYEGDAEDFAWVVPVVAQPEISVGSNSIFGALHGLTDPQYYVSWQDDIGECGYGDEYWGAPRAEGASDFDAAADGDADEDPQVVVLDRASVGAYETATISSDDSGALIEWLAENDYRIPDEARPQIEAYVAAGDVFVALKLQKNATVGSITPIVLRFPETGPCIPLRLTSIAATPDMPIWAFVLAPHRAISTNFLDVEVNDAAIDWFGYGQNYTAVVTKAVDEAWSHAFVTEFAGDASGLEGSFFREGQYDTDALRALRDPDQFIQALLNQGFPRDSTMQELLRQFIPMPAELVEMGITEQEFYGCVSCWADYLDGFVFDPEAFVDALEERLIEPLRSVEEMVGRQRYLTRLFTTISADEMTDDPIFRFNPDVPDVSNVHTAEAVRLCGNGRDYEDAPVRLTLPDGRVIVYSPGDPGYPGNYAWVDDNGDGINDVTSSAPDYMPSAERARRLGEAGTGEILLDNTAAIDDAIAGRFGRPHSATGGGLGCHVAPADGARRTLPLLLLVGLGLAAFFLRRK
ncbi:MAG: DUF2330 domain-containing protein [Deltaproteobacteria bacterium]|nr:DUF2330 domain-containing protein [Deltaproteobacteria bacterium]